MASLSSLGDHWFGPSPMMGYADMTSYNGVIR